MYFGTKGENDAKCDSPLTYNLSFSLGFPELAQ